MSYSWMTTTSDVAKENNKEESPKNNAKDTCNDQKGIPLIEQNQSLTKEFI